MAKRSKDEIEMIRRGYYGDLIKICQRRYGNELPDDDAGRETLLDLLALASLAMVNPAKKMSNIIGLQAPWINGEEAEFIDIVNRMPISERWRIANTLGERHRVTYADHQSFGLRNVTPCDKTSEELAELRKARKREREKARRQRGGAKSLAEYRAARFAGSIRATEPWVPLGISRASFFRNRKKEKQRRLAA